jgi:hypothetical protein
LTSASAELVKRAGSGSDMNLRDLRMRDADNGAKPDAGVTSATDSTLLPSAVSTAETSGTSDILLHLNTILVSYLKNLSARF